MSPADITTRGVFNIKELLKSDEKRNWLKGPTFLSKLDKDSTCDNHRIKELDPGDTEIKKTFIATLGKIEGTLIIYENYSRFDKIVRILAWIIRFINNCRSKTRKNPLHHFWRNANLHKDPYQICTEKRVLRRNGRSLQRSKCGKNKQITSIQIISCRKWFDKNWRKAKERSNSIWRKAPDSNS